MNVIKIIIEHFALWLLRLTGTKIIVYPVHMLAYHKEITELCEFEAKQFYQTSDILGEGYFKARRVMQQMKKKYPYLKNRDLWKAVDICSDSMDSINGRTGGQPLQPTTAGSGSSSTVSGGGAVVKGTLTLVLMLALPTLAKAQSLTTVTGTVYGTTGVVSSTTGYVEFTITPSSSSLQYYVSGTGVIAPQASRCAINNTTGAVVALSGSGSCQVWGNDLILPANTLYSVKYAPGGIVRTTVAKMRISGTSYSLNSPSFGSTVSLVPQSTAVIVPPLQANILPAAAHTFTVGSAALPFSSGYFDTLTVSGGTSPIFTTSGAFVASDFTKSADTTLANITGLSATVSSGVTYSCRVVLLTLVLGGGWSVSLSGGTATATNVLAFVQPFGTTGGSFPIGQQLQDLASSTNSNNAPTEITIDIGITVATGGTIIPQFAQQSASSFSRVRRNSFMTCTNLN